MSTVATVDATDRNDGLWVGIAELARRKGVNKSAISRRVAKLQLETRPAPRGGKLVNLAAYDRAVGEVGDPGKEAGAATKAGAPGDPSYRDAQTDKTRYEAELRKLDLAERRGQLISIDAFVDQLDRADVEIVRVLDGMKSRAAEVYSAGLKDGEIGTRRAINQFVFDVRAGIAAALRRIAQEGKKQEAAGLIQVELPLAEEAT